MGCTNSTSQATAEQRGVLVLWEEVQTAAPSSAPTPAAEEPAFVVQRTAALSTVTQGGTKFTGVSLLASELVLFPWHAQEMLILPLQPSPSRTGDPPSQSQSQSQGQAASARALRPPAACGTAGSFWGACEVEAGGSPVALAAPCLSNAVLSLTPSGRCQTLPLGNLACADGWRGCAALGGKVYCAPFCAEKMLELEVKSGSVRGIDITQALTSGEGSNNVYKWWGLCSFRQRLLFAAPWNAQQLLELKPQTRRVRGLPLPAGLTFSGSSGDVRAQWKFGGPCSLGDAVFCVPCHADQLLIHFPDTGRSSLRDVTAVARGDTKFSAAVAAAGHVVAAPRNAHSVLVYCPETDVLSGVDLTPHLRPGSLTDSDKYLDLCTDGQRVFLAPGSADKVLELAPRRSSQVPMRFSSLIQQMSQTPSGAALPRLAPGQIEEGLRDADCVVKEMQDHRSKLEQRKQDPPKTYDERMRDLQKTFDDGVRELKRQMEQQRSEVEKQISEVDAQQSQAQSLKEALQAQNSVLQDTKEGKRCSFWFLQADRLRNCSPTGLPHFQDLRKQQGDWFVEKVVGLSHARDRSLVKNMLVISHRWEEPGAPDPTGLQLREIQKHLRRYPDLELVRYDFWCLPQGERTAAEKEEFKLALPNVNLLYLSASILLLVDLSYVSRFWTQLEAWLSMQSVKGANLAGTTDDELRCSIVCIHNAPPSFEVTLKDLWRNKTTEEARGILAKPDVVVTNASDKAVQLEKLEKLKDLIKSVA